MVDCKLSDRVVSYHGSNRFGIRDVSRDNISQPL